MIVLIIVLVAVSFMLTAVYVTDPFARLSIVKQPFVIEMLQGMFKVVNENHRITVRQAWYWKAFAYFKSGLHVFGSRYLSSPRAQSKTLEGVINDIHALRFKPDKLLLISGDHFSALYPRNLGVFYYPLLDSRLPSSEQDWENRQVVYLQTIAYALGVFEKNPIPATTVVTTGKYAATCINIWSYPSDTLYGILYTLSALLGNLPATPAPELAKPVHKLETMETTQHLVNEYHDTLVALYEHYRTNVFDEETGLIRSDRFFSGAKDMTRRKSSFYDNVIFWKTHEMAAKIGLIPDDAAFRDALKQRILKTYWLEDEGYFLEDLSEDGLSNAHYSSDWLIVLATGFLSPKRASERKYFERSVAYIQAQGIDQPFAIKYQHETRAYRQFIVVRLVVANYGGEAIWSFWGMEYIKSLLLLYNATGKQEYLKAADHHIAAYEHAMVRDGGFPETYDKDGKMLETPLYRSVRQTGWVVGFEQVRTIRAALSDARK